MAETKRRGRPKKVETPVEIEEKKVDNSQDELIKKLMAQLEEQNAKMAEMQKQIEDNNKPQTVVVNNENNYGIHLKEEFIMFDYPRNYAEFVKQDPDLYAKRGEDFKTEVIGLLYLIDESLKSDKGAGRQYLWHMAKFFAFDELGSHPVLKTKLRFQREDVIVIIQVDYREDRGWGYLLRYFHADSGEPFSKGEVKQGYLWEDRFDKLKLQDILRTNYIRFKKEYGAY